MLNSTPILLLLLSITTRASILTGKWTTIPQSPTLPLHDAIEINSNNIVTCQHGGYLNLTTLPCTITKATIHLHSNNNTVQFNNQNGLYTDISTNCSWTSAAPGNYWTGASAYPPPFTPSCSRIQFNNGNVWIKLREINKVHIVSMSHLDVGYTGSIAYTLNSYFTNFFPTAIQVQNELDAMKLNNTNVALRYITHPWLVYLYLHCDELTEMIPDLDVPIQCPNTTTLTQFHHAVQRGTITYHAGPMNMQVEWMSPDIFNFGIDMSHALDDIFKLPHKTTLSQRDVPGMTRGVVPLLQKRGVNGITVGVNGGVCPAQVPMLFRWQVNDSSVVASWHPGGYPDEYVCSFEKHTCNEQVAGPLARRQCMISKDEAFCFAFRTDNTGPPVNAQEVLAGYHVAQTQFPGSSIVAGSLDSFFQMAQTDSTLPVVTGEIGDVWIPGVASDPWKASVTRRMQRAWDAYNATQKATGVTATGIRTAAAEKESKSLFKAGAYLLKLTEHTWGLSDLLNKSKNWTNSELEKQLAAGDFDVNVADWDLQRDFTRFAQEALPNEHPLKMKWQDIINRPTPTQPNLDSYVVASETSKTVQCPFSSLDDFTIESDLGTLSVNELILGKYTYENVNEQTYNVTKFACDAVFGGKRGSSNYMGGETSKEAFGVTDEIYFKPLKNSSHGTSTTSTKNGTIFSCDIWQKLKFQGKGDGMPQSAWIHHVISNRSVDVEFIVIEKERTRFNEAAWLSFEEVEQSQGSVWGMKKLGYDLQFDDVVSGGSNTNHAADLVWLAKKNLKVTINSLDAPVLAPVNIHRPPSVLLNDQEKLQDDKDIRGVGFNLWNNVWSTNYLFFYPW